MLAVSKFNRNKAVGRLLNRVRDDSYFMGKMLSEYEVLHGMNDQQLALYLECKDDQLARLFLCSVPGEASQQFRKDVARIADFAGCDADKLISIMREIGSIAALRGGESHDSSRGLLVAARDRCDEKTDNKADAASKSRRHGSARKKNE